jgi:hypothetical protein
MPFEVTPLIPVVGTVAAALVAGGIARANLIASKETKISEFRQAWINALREDLAALFSNTRTLARALQEARLPPDEMYSDFVIDKASITRVRHGAAETYHRIRLRLNAKQADHTELLRLLSEMMGAMHLYMADKSVEIKKSIDAVEAAARYAEEVLKTEWEKVKEGEDAYKSALSTTRYTLIGSFAVLALLVLGYPVYYWRASALEAEAKATAARQALAVPAKATPVTSPKPALAPPAAAGKSPP